MSARTLPDRRTVLRGGAALIASVTQFSPRRDSASAAVAALPLQDSASPTAPAAARRRVPVGLL